MVVGELFYIHIINYDRTGQPAEGLRNENYDVLHQSAPSDHLRQDKRDYLW